MKKKKWWLVPLIGVLILLGIGGKLVIDKQNKAEKLQKEMIEVVKSEEAKQVFEEGLKNLDPKALTPEGVIQSYEIDYDSIEHNPMGGIDGEFIVNKDKNLIVLFRLDKDSNGKFSSKYVISGNSGELGKMLRKEKKK
ncbi:DUF1310 family protein [Enterococcus faecium]|uniref:DUF1310 family protein n=1 Tax=Enterococcus faecium TaxID=1352 RepID=UPI000989A36D|nr:DUF1310 family protein [Enterococcus faecium]SJX70384.1 hypothetical secreted protein [Enterococcus faecium]